MLEITKNHKFFKQMYMVCKSIAGSDSRYLLKHVEVNEKHIVATNGKRLACLDNYGIEVGRYEVCKLTKSLIKIVKIEVDGKFPPYMEIIPDKPEACDLVKITDPENAWSMPNAIKARLSSAYYAIAQKGACLYIDYLADYVACDTFHVIGSDRPVCLYMDGFTAVIMPINPKAL